LTKKPRRPWWKTTLIVLGALIVLYIIFLISFMFWTRSGSGPRIGLSVSDLWYDRLQWHRAPYDLAVKKAGGRVVTIEPQDLKTLDPILDEVDALLLAGGGDVDPELFGGDPSKSYFVDRERDNFEIALLKRAQERALPVLAICRGIQILVVAEGGTLRNLESDPDLADRHGVTIRSYKAHDVWIQPGTRLHRLLGEGPHSVNSFHIQAVEHPGPRLKIAAVDADGVIEAVELPGDRMVIGIQWHPELQAVTDVKQRAPFEMLIEEARKHHASRLEH
jgi:putative glutamine amidotransferase